MLELSRPWPRQENKRIVDKTGIDLIRDPLLNKGTAFTQEERSRLRLHGLLPFHQTNMDIQARRIRAAMRERPRPLDQYLELSALQDRNEQLFYHMLCEHLEEYMPIVYTPTVAQATRNFSQVFRRGRGVWLTPAFRGHIAKVLDDAAGDRPVRLIVATDNESILGIGDQGAGGMAIAVGKLALYTAGAGIPPEVTLPVSLDVGTENEELLADEMYLGWREPRLRGAAYDAFLDEFVDAVGRVFPQGLIQWEDLRKDIALRVLDRFRGRIPSFNDDIQGTGAVALAGLMTSMRLSGIALHDQRIVILGAGAAGLGIARQLRLALGACGLAGEELVRRIAVLDRQGLLIDDGSIRDAYKHELAWPLSLARQFGLAEPAHRHLEAVVRTLGATVLIGSSGQPGAFSESVVRAMAATVERPLILPFSNPTDQAEATPAELLAWTGGRAIVATGSPFGPVEYQGRRVCIGQGNNVFIFPGLGLGALLGGVRGVSDEMLTASAHALASCVSAEELASGLIFPAIHRLREVSRAVAVAFIRAARREPGSDGPADDLDALVERAMWRPRYAEYFPAAPDGAGRGAKD